MCSQILLTNVGYLILLIFALRSQMQKERDETKEAVADIAKSLQVTSNVFWYTASNNENGTCIQNHQKQYQEFKNTKH